jgi:hypothetical protein
MAIRDAKGLGHRTSRSGPGCGMDARAGSRFVYGGILAQDEVHDHAAIAIPAVMLLRPWMCIPLPWKRPKCVLCSAFLQRNQARIASLLARIPFYRLPEPPTNFDINIDLP